MSDQIEEIVDTRLSNNIESFIESDEESEVNMASFNGARPKQYSNVIVDESPLQNQMEKNKECKYYELVSYLENLQTEITYRKFYQIKRSFAEMS